MLTAADQALLEMPEDPFLDLSASLRCSSAASRVTSKGLRKAMMLALLLHVTPLVLLMLFAAPVLFGSFSDSEGESGWVRLSPVLWKGSVLVPGDTRPVPEEIPSVAPAVRPSPSGTPRALKATEEEPKPLGAEASRGPTAGEGASLGSAGDTVSAVWNPRPVYPERARRARWEGVVELELLIGSDGSVDSVRVLSSSGHALLDEAALAAVKRWRFTPLIGTSGPVRRTLPVSFVLDKG